MYDHIIYLCVFIPVKKITTSLSEYDIKKTNQSIRFDHFDEHIECQLSEENRQKRNS